MALGGRKTLVALSVVVALGLSAASRADATLVLAGTADGNDFCAVDNDAFVCGHGMVISDVDGAVGVLDLGASNTFGAIELNGAVSAQLIGPPFNILASSTIAIRNTNAIGGASADLTLAISATDFVGPATEAVTTGSGTWVVATGSTADLGWWNDPGNAQGAETPGDRPGGLVDFFSDTADDAADSFSHNGGPFAVNDPGLFSMTLGLDVTLTGGGRLISEGMAEIKPTDVPEPASMALFGLGLAAVGAISQRRRLRK
jgi:hypothetical protein